MLRTGRLTALSIAAALALGAAGCSTDQLAGAGIQVTSSVADGGPEGRATADQSRNPFGDTGDTSGLREVMQNPSLAEILKPGPLPEMVMGRADAPVTIIKYASMTCPYCKAFQANVWPALKRDYIDKGKVRFILREFPIGFQSGNATIALRCAKPERYFALYDRLMARQPAWVSMEVRTEPILAAAGDLGPTRAQFDACKADKQFVAAINAVKERGRTLGIIGTPNFFINDRLVKLTLDYNQLKALIDPIIAQGAGASRG